MADVSKFSPDGGLTIYNIKDTVARTVMTGASASSAGAAGQVPAPSAGDNAKFLRGDGAWVDAGSGGGHTILNSSGASMTQRSKLQFNGATVTDDPSNGKTVVAVNGGGTWTSAVSCLVGDTSKTISNSSITTSSVIKPYSQTSSGIPVSYKKIVVSSGSATITFASALTEAASIKLQIL